MKEELKKRGIYYVLLFAFALRGIFLLYLQPISDSFFGNSIAYSDSYSYHFIAHNFYNSGLWSEFNPFRTPLYPFYISVFYYLFGVNTLPVILSQLFLAVVTIYLLYHTVLKITNTKASLLAALLLAAEPYTIIYNSQLLTETLFTFLVVSAVYASVLTSNKTSLAYWLLAGVLFGLASLTRPVGYYLPVFLSVFLILIYFKNWRYLLKVIACLQLAYYLTLSPWLYKNYRDFGVAEMSSIIGFNLYFYNVGGSEKLRTGKTETECVEELGKIKTAAGTDTIRNPMVHSKALQQLAFDYIKKYPVWFILAHIRGSVEVFVAPAPVVIYLMDILHLEKGENSDDTSLGYISRKSTIELLITAMLILYTLLLYLTAIIGCYMAYIRNNKTLLILLVPVMYFFLITGATGGATRYKIPAMPFILVFTALCIAYIWEYEKPFLRKRT